MTPPRMPILLLLNLLMGGGCYLVAVTSFAIWTAAEWSPAAIGLAMMLANLAYSLIVLVGGRLADHWGRARAATIGASLVLSGGLIAFFGHSPMASAIGVVICFGCSGIFFPGNAGLFSDVQAVPGSAQIPLHRKISRYNVGWSSGNLLGFASAWVLSHLTLGWGYALAACWFAAIIPVVARWWSLPPTPPQAEGDRADHPALPGLITLGRIGLLLFCLVGMSVIAQLGRVLGTDLGPEAANRTANAALTCYALGYVLGFVLLGAWEGWVMRPWRLFALSLGMPAASLGLLACGMTGVTQVVALSACAWVLGVAFAAIYTASMYYSMRLPGGAAKGASVHETHLGIGATLGPALCGAFLMATTVDLAGLAWWCLIGSALVIGWQLVRIPFLSR